MSNESFRMRELLRYIAALVLLPWFILSILTRWTLCRIFDPIVFRRHTGGVHFDHVGRWSSGAWMGVYGRFGARVTQSDPTNIMVTIYFSKFQSFRRGEIIERQFQAVSEFDGIPVATKYGDDFLFSYLEGDMLIWIEWPPINAEKGISCSLFHTMRPYNSGLWCITDRTEQDTAE